MFSMIVGVTQNRGEGNCTVHSLCSKRLLCKSHIYVEDKKEEMLLLHFSCHLGISGQPGKCLLTNLCVNLCMYT